MIRRKLHDAGLPEDLLFVAMVESGFDPTIRSPAGALGLWQFVKTTGTDYGLTITPLLDERMHAERATDGAIAFLKDLHGRLGSWDLSLAAFNMGYGGVLRSIRKYNSNDFWRLTELEAGLPYETVNYVTKVLAYAVVGRNPELFGLSNVTRVPTEEVAFVEVPPGVSLERLAHGTGFDAALLAAYNPQLVKGRVPADAVGWQIRVPADRREELVDRLVRMNAPPHRTYVMRFGEQLADVATMFSSSVTALRRLNKLVPEDAIGVGFSLLVPDVEPKLPPVAEPPVIAIPDAETIATGRRQVFYRATGHENCDEIAHFFDVTVDELRAWNHIDTSATLQAGMYVQLFVSEDLDLSRAVVLQASEVRPLVLESEEFFAFHEGLRDRVRVLYRMKSGDTIDKVAERFELSVGSIFRINQFGRERTLRVDDEIVLYVPSSAAIANN
jgi:membrane-bound lytic murein transglycosylase D